MINPKLSYQVNTPSTMHIYFVVCAFRPKAEHKLCICLAKSVFSHSTSSRRWFSRSLSSFNPAFSIETLSRFLLSCMINLESVSPCFLIFIFSFNTVSSCFFNRWINFEASSSFAFVCWVVVFSVIVLVKRMKGMKTKWDVSLTWEGYICARPRYIYRGWSIQTRGIPSVFSDKVRNLMSRIHRDATSLYHPHLRLPKHATQNALVNRFET